MVLSSSENRDKSYRNSSGLSRSPRLSLSCIKGIALALLAFVLLAFHGLWQPAYSRVQTLQKEKNDWLQVMNEGEKATLDPDPFIIPTMDQLPDMIERCCSTFAKQHVDVVSFNVERFGVRQETEKGTNLDYALVRFHLIGQWKGIASSLIALEATQEVSIHIQEVVLASEGGETLLQIFFYSNEG